MATSGTGEAHTQERVFAFLSDPARHPDVRRIDTHAASVFLEDNRVLKIKRAVSFPFLDYSTLQQRKAACEQEVNVNRQFAPQIYRQVVPITEYPDGSLSIGGTGTPIEYAVEMMRFDERGTIDHLARAGKLGPELVNAIAETIASSHLNAARVEAASWLQSIPKIIDDYTNAFKASGDLPASDTAELADATHAAFARIRDLLDRRGRQGYVRRCHGDLHLANIVVIDDEPVLFDAIEFDEKIASTDVLYDLAFPLMDLLWYGRRDASNALLNRYLSITSVDNLDALSTLPLFMSMRAAIRTHVLLARLDRRRAEQTATLQEARAYFDLAKRLIGPPSPRLIAVGGLSGTGKSVLARAFASDILPEPGAIVLRSDVLRKEMFGVAEGERLPEDAYEPEVSGKVYDLLVQRAGRVLAQGHSVIADAVFAREDERATISTMVRNLGACFIGLFLVADLKIRESRIARRVPDASDATAQVARLQERYDIGMVDWTTIDASGTPEATLRACRARISRIERGGQS
jgi:aminoglycoside phosphotransferase family enzyme/predicted kinase